MNFRPHNGSCLPIFFEFASILFSMSSFTAMPNEITTWLEHNLWTDCASKARIVGMLFSLSAGKPQPIKLGRLSSNEKRDNQNWIAALMNYYTFKQLRINSLQIVNLCRQMSQSSSITRCTWRPPIFRQENVFKFHIRHKQSVRDAKRCNWKPLRKWSTWRSFSTQKKNFIRSSLLCPHLPQK